MALAQIHFVGRKGSLQGDNVSGYGLRRRKGRLRLTRYHIAGEVVSPR